MANWPLPVNTHVTGDSGHPADHDTIVTMLQGVSRQRFYIDAYGADPTGVALSDAAWTSCISDVTAAMLNPGSGQNNATSGAIVVFGPGIYNFSTGVISTFDGRIGIIGQGKSVTTLRTTGSGILVQAGGGSEPHFAHGAAPVGGFTLWGGGAAAGATGLQYGDRNDGLLSDVYADSWGGAGSIGFQFLSSTSHGIEGCFATALDAVGCTTGYSFDGNAITGSADYSYFGLHVQGCGTAVQVINTGNLLGSELRLQGNMGGGGFASPLLLKIGTNTSDTAKVTACLLHIAVEADAVAVTDIVITGTNNSQGITGCYGMIGLPLGSGGSWTAGSVTNTQFTFTGRVNGSPLLLVSGGKFQHRADTQQSIQYAADAVQTVTTAGTINVATNGRFGMIPLTTAGPVTGVILEKPDSLTRQANVGIQVTLINRSANSITFAASGTSFVADGASDVIAGLSAAHFTYDSGAGLWYRG